MRPHEICQPSQHCLNLIRHYKPHHRGIVMSFPDEHNCIKVIWQHGRKRKPTLMAGHYVEPAKENATR